MFWKEVTQNVIKVTVDPLSGIQEEEDKETASDAEGKHFHTESTDHSEDTHLAQRESREDSHNEEETESNDGIQGEVEEALDTAGFRRAPSSTHEMAYTDYTIQSLVDDFLSAYDKNDDGYVEYFEFKLGRDKEEKDFVTGVGHH